MSIMFTKLLSEQDINRIKDKFIEDTDIQLEEAIRKHYNISATSIPWWIYALLAFFAMDNVMSWISSPLIFYPLMMVFGVISMLYAMGLGGVMLPLARQSINLALRRVNVNFQL
mmetsp:Transcript_45372/g.33152  ORF Transcript_45372/g.33152 Transcript_45372/m.33152 type:complete len:114 (-) Transcript_45372:27-368(-)